MLAKDVKELQRARNSGAKLVQVDASRGIELRIGLQFLLRTGETETASLVLRSKPKNDAA